MQAFDSLPLPGGGLASYQFTVNEFGEESQRKDAKETERGWKERRTGFFAIILSFASLRWMCFWFRLRRFKIAH